MLALPTQGFNVHNMQLHYMCISAPPNEHHHDVEARRVLYL